MRLKEEQKIIMVGIFLTIIIILQLCVTSLSGQRDGYYQLLQEENVGILKSYGTLNALGINYLNLNGTILKLFGWRQGDKPLGEAMVKTISLYHELSPAEQKKWSERTLFEYYFNKSNRLSSQLNIQYKQLGQLTKNLEQNTAVYSVKIRNNNRLVNIILFINLVILFLCIFMYCNVLSDIANRLK